MPGSGPHPTLRRWRNGLATLLLLGASALAPTAEAELLPRFFLAGPGRLQLAHGHFPDRLDARYRHADGRYDPQALADIEHFFRSRGDSRTRPVSRRLVELLAWIQQEFHPRQMTLLSGYRSPEFNADLGAAGQAVAMASLHTQTLAADVALSGVDLKRIWVSLRERKVGGVGYYRSQNFLHVDTGPPRFWEAGTSRVGENLSAGNARLFARTDYDRYPDLVGALITLHSVTALPLQVAALGEVVDRRHSWPIVLRGRGAMERDGDCWRIGTPEPSYELEITEILPKRRGPGEPASSRPYLRLATCAPRLDRTPNEIRSNPIELRLPIGPQTSVPTSRREGSKERVAINPV